MFPSESIVKPNTNICWYTVLMSTKARNQPAKSPCSYASNWSMCYPSNCPQFTCIKVKSDLKKLKIKDQRSRSFEKITTGDLYQPKRSRSPVVILKIKIKDHDLAHLWLEPLPFIHFPTLEPLPLERFHTVEGLGVCACASPEDNVAQYCPLRVTVLSGENWSRTSAIDQS